MDVDTIIKIWKDCGHADNDGKAMKFARNIIEQHSKELEGQVQDKLMKYDPATGEERPYPSHAHQWRIWHGDQKAWLFNPWTGHRRLAGDVGSDVQGWAIGDGYGA